MQATGLADAERQALGKEPTRRRSTPSSRRTSPPFVGVFGGRPGSRRTATEATLEPGAVPEQRRAVRGWLAPRPGNLIDRLRS